MSFFDSLIDHQIDNQKTESNILPITNGIDRPKSKLIMNGHEMNGNNNYLNYDDHNDHDNESLNSNCKFESDYCVNVAQLVC